MAAISGPGLHVPIAGAGLAAQGLVRRNGVLAGENLDCAAALTTSVSWGRVVDNQQRGAPRWVQEHGQLRDRSRMEGPTW